MIPQTKIQQFTQDGFTIARNLFSPDEAASYRDHYMRLREQGEHPGDFSGVDVTSGDPLKKYPRMIHMHRWDQASLDWLIDPRLNAYLSGLCGREPYAVQTMIYFKPPQARGQALHQDQYYLRAQPGTCIAAWMALDACDEENGCLRVVPGSQNWPLLCTVKADTTQSFTDVTVPIPAGTAVGSVILQPGDVLFFNGQVVHGSGPNRSASRFRRALIGHYIAGEAREVAKYYHPALRMDGSVIELGTSEGGGSCGVWVDRDGRPEIELAGVEGLAKKTE
jgi:phytanoyl-CoA hydroxylase